jgi:hypothetical protein
VPSARPTDPETSHQAAESISETHLRASQGWVLAVLSYTGPTTDVDLVATYEHFVRTGTQVPPQSQSGIRSRRAELVEQGLVYDTGLRRRLPSGRQAVVWNRVAT